MPRPPNEESAPSKHPPGLGDPDKALSPSSQPRRSFWRRTQGWTSFPCVPAPSILLGSVTTFEANQKEGQDKTRLSWRPRPGRTLERSGWFRPRALSPSQPACVQQGGARAPHHWRRRLAGGGHGTSWPFLLRPYSQMGAAWGGRGGVSPVASGSGAGAPGPVALLRRAASLLPVLQPGVLQTLSWPKGLCC